jgi:hypothetical protein
MTAEARLVRAWHVPAWEGAEPDVATRVLPPARTLDGEPPDTALAVPDLRRHHVAALARSLRGTSEALRDRPVGDVVRALGRVGERFLSAGDPLREEALATLPGTSGLSPAMCREVLDGMARDWTEDRLTRLLRAEFGDPRCLDRFVAEADGETGGGRELRAMGSRLAFHLSAGSVPGVSATSLVRSLLVKSPVLLKPGRGDVALPVLMARALAREDPGLARAAAVIYWPGGDASAGLEQTALEEADLVVAYGSDAVVRSLRSRLPATTPLVAYHHRLGFGIVGRAALTPDAVAGAAHRAARSVGLFDQRGCVSPHVLFVEEGAGLEAFVAALADGLEGLERELPRGRVDTAEASAAQQLKGTFEMRRAAGQDVEVRAGRGGRWTVVLERGGRLVPSCLGRVVRVVPVEDAADVPALVEDLGDHLQTAGVEGVPTDRLRTLAETLARAGVLRVAPLGKVAFPPAWWRHDGRGPLEVLARWVEMEGGGEPAP